ncbi:MAG: hypothetical protein H6744_04875 [Deltaproteobacteria bacterium]|nr:hypothetical protein [Deltaproteobacteria bacterium]MCB9786010.1 hypothetical protein [Deltaproteobacteria bacterium]
MMPRALSPILPLLLAAAVCACAADPSPGSDADAGPDGSDASLDATADVLADLGPDLAPPQPELWPAGPDFDATTGLPAAWPALSAHMSTWVTHVAGPVAQRPDTGHRGGYGTGNGRVFALFGLTDPMNTMHGMTGPTYERGKRFFGDYSVSLTGPGVAAESDEEWTAMSLSAPVLFSRARFGALWLETLDFVPPATDPAGHCMVRVIEVRNAASEATAALELRVAAAVSVTSPTPDRLLEQTGERALTTGFLSSEGQVDGKVLTHPVGPLAPGAHARLTLLHCTAQGDAAVDLPELDLDATVAALVAEHAAWRERLVGFELPDPRVSDFLDGMAMTLRVQTSVEGANCPMSEYTRVWARDTIGAVLAWLRLGAHEEVRALMTYLYGAASERGDLQNSYDADLDLDPPPAPPDWDALGPLAGKVAAETPSYMVWTAAEWLRFTGDAKPLADRWPFYRRCLLRQVPNEDGLLPFTGDETFRTAMNVAFGYPLESPHHEESWSANSSLLWLGAARGFDAMARATGHEADLAQAATLEATIRQGLMDYYLLEDGCIAALVVRATGETLPEPFEDVALKLTWAGAEDGDSELARAATRCLIERLGTEPGRFQSPIDGNLADFPLLGDEATGVYTGMLPGYALSALTDVGHPDAEAAFVTLSKVLGSSGNLQEYQVAPDDSGLTLLYDPSGALGDYTAKFRPWEGGIVAAAAVDYLVGFEPDASSKELALRPHLPSGWPDMTVRRLRAGDARFDVEVSARGAERRVTLSTDATTPWQVTLRWDSAEAVSVARASGEAVKASSAETLGALSTTTEPLSVSAQAPLELVIRPGVAP